MKIAIKVTVIASTGIFFKVINKKYLSFLKTYFNRGFFAIKKNSKK